MRSFHAFAYRNDDQSRNFADLKHLNIKNVGNDPISTE